MESSAARERLNYINRQNRWGGYIVVLHEGLGIAHGTFRFSADGGVLYLNGSAVDANYPQQGLYHDMLHHRLQMAKERGAKYVTVQSKRETSALILKKLDITEYGEFVFWKITH